MNKIKTRTQEITTLGIALETEQVNKMIETSRYPWLKDRIILLVKTGSYAHGTNTENSDRDYKGICIPPSEYYLGLQEFKSIDINTNNHKQKNIKDDIDITIYSIEEFFKQAIKGNPNILEMLFVESDSLLYASKEGRELGVNRKMFLSNHIESSFGGYANSLRKQLKFAIEISPEDTNKKIMTAVRIYKMAIHLFKTGELLTRPEEDTIKYLRDIRSNKKDSGKEIISLDTLEYEFRESFKNSVLPEDLDLELIESILIKMVRDNI